MSRPFTSVGNSSLGNIHGIIIRPIEPAEMYSNTHNKGVHVTMILSTPVDKNNWLFNPCVDYFKNSKLKKKKKNYYYLYFLNENILQWQTNLIPLRYHWWCTVVVYHSYTPFRRLRNSIETWTNRTVKSQFWYRLLGQLPLIFNYYEYRIE